MDTIDTNHRRKEDTPLQKNLQSLRVVIEGLTLIGIVWIAATQTQQGKDLVEVKTKLTAAEELSKQVPDIKSDVRLNTRDLNDLDTRVDGLEAFRKIEK
jgi:hypothetical protein